MAGGRYRLVPRPASAGHGYPFLVFDGQGELHLPLTIFGKEAAGGRSRGTTRTYLNAILPFFAYLDQDSWEIEAGRRWDSEPGEIRIAVHEYLMQRLRCKVREHRQGFQLVSITAGTESTVRVFLSALKLFYRVGQQHGLYRYRNPLVDTLKESLASLATELEAERPHPRMPDESGIEESRRGRRLTDSYFVLEGEEWQPRVVDDETLFARVLLAGRKAGWSLREECVTRLLFETGGRVSEITGLTLGDWHARGLLQEANAFSKGSHGLRVKFLRFSPETSKLLRQYIDGERRRWDSQGWGLSEYLQLGREKRVNLGAVPLFLTTRGTTLSPKTFRENYWNKACSAVGLDVDVHQARHWYVTMAVRQIHEREKTEAGVNRRLRELIEYMKWKQGWQTMEAYEHYFDAANHAEVNAEIHAKMDNTLQTALKERLHRQSAVTTPPPPVRTPVTAAEPDEFEVFLERMGGDYASHT